MSREIDINGNKSFHNWLDKGMEVLWLLTVLLVPLAFLNRDYAISEAVIGYIEVPKIALLRLLTGLMAVLWLIEWGTQSSRHDDHFLTVKIRWVGPSAWLAGLAVWLHGHPHRWLILAVWFYLATTLVSTILSGSPSVSIWGEIPGQDSYPAYTVVSYVVLFAIIATHLKTWPQLWRLLGAIMFMGVVVSGYAVFQHYGHDFLDLMESTGGGTTSFMGNRIFAGAVMLMTIPITLAAATITLRSSGSPPSFWGKALLWTPVLTVQALGIIFVYSRGPWVGTLIALLGFLIMVALFVGWRTLVRAVFLLGLSAALTTVVILGPPRLESRESTPITAAPAPDSSVGEVSSDMPAGQPAPEPSVGEVSSDMTAGQSASDPSVGEVSADMTAGQPASDPSVGEVSADMTAGQPGPVAAVAQPEPSLLDAFSVPNIIFSDTEAGRLGERFTSIVKEVSGGFTGGRMTHWKVSGRLIKDHPWFEFDSLSLRWLRPLVGYGPDLFRYIYLVESLPEGKNLFPLEPDHAHNYFVHQTVEQGYLGLLSSLGLFAAVIGVGGYQLLRTAHEHQEGYKLILVALLAVAAGRFLEMMVGVARVSDLVVLWVLLGIFAALPQVTGSQEAQVKPRRRKRRGNRPRSVASPMIVDNGWQWLWRLAVVATLVGGIVTLTWVKGLNYPRAAVKVGEAAEHSRRGDLPSTLAALDRAIELAPDVPVYHNWRASTYLAFRTNTQGPPEQQCLLQQDLPYQACLAALSHRSNLDASEQRPFYYRSRVALANSAFNLKLYDESIQYYREALALLPSSWSLRNRLAAAYLEKGESMESLQPLQESLAITEGRNLSSEALFLQAKAHADLGQFLEAINDLDQAIRIYPEVARGYISRALAHTNLGQDTKAQQDIDQAVELGIDRVTLEQAMEEIKNRR